MATRNWTDEQKDAINGRGGTLLLSAAAGSGKTAVLVERVLQRLIDPVFPCNPENLLIVTFTNAAAAEMKQKIINALSEYAAGQGKIAEFFKLRVQINNADICTMDKFCIKLVRENFSLLDDIMPDFRICEGGELDIMRAAAMEQTLNELHDSYPEILEPLTDMFFREKNDNNLTSCISKLYDESCSYPFPYEWLDGTTEMYNSEYDIAESAWGKLILESAKDVLLYSRALYKEITDALIEESKTDPALYDAFHVMLEDEFEHIELCIKLTEKADWDALYGQLQAYKADTFRAPKGYAQHAVKVFAANKRDIVKKNMGELKKMICATRLEHKEDMEILKPVASALVFAAKLFSENFRILKREANSLDFSDTLHEALKLLYVNEGGEWVKSELAQRLCEQYAEILIDEYQDTNEAQDMLFRGLSKDEKNLFMVGDVKQSIYRFRKANPEIFIRHSEMLEVFNKEKNNYPAKVILGKNFRSSRKVIDSVNYIFSRIMSKKAGGLTYGKDEMLYCGRKDSGEYGGAQLRLLDLAGKPENLSDTEAEADYIAELIEKAVKEKELVFDEKNGSRPLNYGDFCILLRAASTKLSVYVIALKRRGIPVLNNGGKIFFDSREVRMLISLLKVISNPLNDIEFLSVMLSPFYGFTPDEAAEMRINYPDYLSLYEKTKKSSADGNPKAAKLLNDLERYRFLSATGTASSFLRKLLDETKFRAAVLAMEDGEARNGNISYMIELAEGYDSYGARGASGFIRYINELMNADCEKQNSSARINGPGAAIGASGSVNIMTIHSSKGLEFPVVILADCMKDFNRMDLNKDLLINPKLRLGIKILDVDKYRKYPSLAYNAVHRQMEDESLSEEMRLLYVALTRAREKLIMVASKKNIEHEILKIANALVRDADAFLPESIKMFTSYGEWLIAAFLYGEDGGKIRDLLNDYPFFDEFIISGESGIDIVIDSLACPKIDSDNKSLDNENPEETENNYDIHESGEASFDDEIRELSEIVRERVEYEYPYLDLSRVVSKYAASSLSHGGVNLEFAASSKPEFMKKDKLEGADAGTAAHLFLQYCNFTSASEDFYAELERLIYEGFLTKQQANSIKAEKILAFLNGSLGKRILAAEEIHKESRFAITLDAKEIDSTLSEKSAYEQVFIQGVTDIVFIENGEAVIVDYKTDRVKTMNELAEKYAMQLSVYRKAVNRVFTFNVKQALIYSLYLDDYIEINS